MILYLWGLPETYTLSLIKRKHASGKFQLRDVLHKTRPLVLRTVKVVQNKENLRSCHSRETP